MSPQTILEHLDAEAVPQKKPLIRIESSSAEIESIFCSELQWWFLVPQVGNSALAFRYDLETDDLSIINHMACQATAAVHGKDCTECHCSTWSFLNAWRCEKDTWYCALEPSKTTWLAVVTEEDAKKSISTFKDDDFWDQWGNVGDRSIRDTGRFKVIGAECYAMQESEGLGAGVFEVSIGERKFTCLRVLDVGQRASEHDELGEAYITREGRTVLYRQYRGRFLGANERDWRERFPNNPQLVVDGCVYVQCNCTGRSHDVLSNIAFGIEL